MMTQNADKKREQVQFLCMDCVLRHRADTGAFASGHSAAATDSVLVSHFPFNHNDVVFCHTLKQRVR